MKHQERRNVQRFLNWKIERNDDSIDYIQIAKYLNIDHRSSEDIIRNLYENQFLIKWYSIKCPECGHYTEMAEDEETNSCSCWECSCIFDERVMSRREIYYKINSRKVKEVNEQKRNLMLVRGGVGGSNMEEQRRIKVFLSYSHEDEEYKNELDKHLSVQKRSGRIETWNDRELVAGENIHQDIDDRLVEADIIILLLSADFFASDYCYSTEMGKALQLHEEKKNVIIPVIVRPCDWLDSPLKDIVALPTDGKAISSWENKDDAYVSVVNGIKTVIKSFI